VYYTSDAQVAKNETEKQPGHRYNCAKNKDKLLFNVNNILTNTM